MAVLTGDVVGVRGRYLSATHAVRTRALPTYELSSQVRLTKSRPEYLLCRATRKELPYEALLATGTDWSIGDRIRVYRKRNGLAGVVTWDSDATASDPRDYDIEYYVRLLRSSYAQRLARAFTSMDFEALFSSPDQFSLFGSGIEAIRPILTILPTTNA